MRRAIVNSILLLLAFVLQTSVFPFVRYLIVSPNFLLIIVFTIAFVYGEKEGIIYGAISGLLLDFFCSSTFGYYTLIFGWIGFLNGFFSRFYYDDFIFLPVIMCTINELMFNLLSFIVRFIERGKTDLLSYAKTIMMPELILTLLFTLIFYRFILSLNRTLKKLDEEKKGAKLVQ